MLELFILMFLLGVFGHSVDTFDEDEGNGWGDIVTHILFFVMVVIAIVVSFLHFRG